MPRDTTYICALPEFVDKTIGKWAKDKKETLEPKLTRNFEAVTNKDFRERVWKKEEGEGWRSTTWVGFVRVKIWAFYSMMSDTVLKAGKIPFTLEPSKYFQGDESQAADRDARIERMTDKIHDQLAARHADREYMHKWLSGAYYGMAFSKFDVEPVESMEFKQVPMDIGPAAQYLSPEEMAQYTRYEMVKESEDTPGSRYVSVWNMVWDMDGGIQDGEGCAERIKSSAYELKQLIGKPGYIPEAIQRVIDAQRFEDADDKDTPAEHPGKADLQDRKKKFTRFEFYMRAPIKLVTEFEDILRSGDNEVAFLSLIEDYEEAEESGDDIEIMGEICNKEIIRYIRNETGRRVHKMWVIEENLDETTGTGIADNMEDVQGSLVGMLRAFEDNKKLSANVTSAVKARFFNKPDQLDDIVPGKKYDISDSCDDVRKAIMPIVFPDVGESLLSGINLMMQLKDDVSMVPTIMQGFTLPKHDPDTAYEMRQLTENAGKYIGQAIRNNDEQFIEPEVTEIYEYNMLYDEDESCKVNAKVIANGFTSFQNKEIRGERMKQALGAFVTNEIMMPYVKVKPHLDIIYESMDEDPDKFIKSEQEMMQEAQQQADQQALAEQKALAAMRAEKQVEASVKAAELSQKHAQDVDKGAREHAQDLEKGAQEHRFETIQEEQEHINEMEQATLEAKLDAAYQKPETQGGS